jgi:hypothetical protein
MKALDECIGKDNSRISWADLVLKREASLRRKAVNGGTSKAQAAQAKAPVPTDKMSRHQKTRSMIF